jgi:hypothetical protein
MGWEIAFRVASHHRSFIPPPDNQSMGEERMAFPTHFVSLGDPTSMTNFDF